MYVDHEINYRNYERVDKLFQRCLMSVPNMDLWRSYLLYIQTTREKAPNGREQVGNAFEFALEHMSLDISCSPIWNDYLQWLKDFKPSNSQEEGHKIASLRRVYQRAIQTPMHNLEAIWKEYDAFENELNKILAKAMVNEHAPMYMNARAVFREKKRYYEGILRNLLARPPGHQVSGLDKEDHQLALWKRLLVYEKANPQRLEPLAFANRVVFTYNQALLCMYHYPELWFEFANFYVENNRIEESIAVYRRALVALPKCHLLYFAFADLLESNKSIKEATEVYESALQRGENALVYIQYMKFMARTSGVKAARPIFKRARTSPVASYPIFVMSGLMEWQRNKDPQVARNVFDVGMAKFGTDPAYVIEYIRFLSHLNEENNLRVLFERAVSQIPTEKAKEIWNMYSLFENSYGDLATLTKIEKRKQALYPDPTENGIMALVNRYKYMNLWPCTPNELDSFGREAAPKEDSTAEKEEEATDLLQAMKSIPKLSRFPKPDFSQLIPYTAEVGKASGGPTIPDVITTLMANLPSSQGWSGPFYNVDEVMAYLKDAHMPPPPDSDKKRKPDEEDEEEDPMVRDFNPAPARDIFRQRQAAKLSKKQM
eukprot:TRINITY_DN10397_c0_g1_i2.p1 TRINITY_DN10397_c0_g1~~TRINITY_DN10397_c0_g1_i2.p1  ORF type:complete len:685 (-),score=185.73 TRINITY_DN10397_c0_g1_i2:48-1850(-)